MHLCALNEETYFTYGIFFGRLVFRYSTYLCTWIFLKSNNSRFKEGKMDFLKLRVHCSKKNFDLPIWLEKNMYYVVTLVKEIETSIYQQLRENLVRYFRCYWVLHSLMMLFRKLFRSPVTLSTNPSENIRERTSLILHTSRISNHLHTVSFDWFLSGLEWILNLEFC